MAQSARSRRHSPASEPPSVQLVQELAKKRGCSPTELEPLYGTVDLESLDELVEQSAGELSIEVTVGGERLTVDGDGTVSVR